MFMTSRLLNLQQFTLNIGVEITNYIKTKTPKFIIVCKKKETIKIQKNKEGGNKINKNLFNKIR